MQSIEDIEKHYETIDPWGYQTYPDDLIRKNKIIQVAQKYALKAEDQIHADKLMDGDVRKMHFLALDIGCGEGWITKNLPAIAIYGLEVSQNAKKRWAKKIYEFDPEFNIKYDLIIATGILYPHYDLNYFIDVINTYSNNIIITCNIKDWETGIDQIQAPQIYEEEFPYREFVQKLRVFKK